MTPRTDEQIAALAALAAVNGVRPDTDDVAGEALRSRFTPGGSFILDLPEDPTPLWGRNSEVLLADGESLLIAAAQGRGKTTLAQQLTLGRCGFPEYDTLLGYPIRPGDRQTLYLAMDRPRQAARSFRRMVGEAWRERLDDLLTVWQGPPIADLARHPGDLLAMCQEADADTVVVDSLKDAAIGLSDDEVGAGYNRARQIAIAAGVQIIELHHLRKATQGSKAVQTLDDLYGSTWLTNGAGSVLLLTGESPVVTLRHLRAPVDEVGPLQVIHDYDTGRSTVFQELDLLDLAHKPISAVDTARALYDVDQPTSGQKQKARRRLERLQKAGALTLVQAGDSRTNQPALWVRV